MKLSQLEYFLQICESDFNISLAAVQLYTTQPAVSKQIAALEEELNISLFIRRGKKIVKLSSEGQRVFEYAQKALREVENIRQIREAYHQPDAGTLSIATTHTQARYFLPKVLAGFTKRYPNVELHIEQNSPQQNAKLVADGTTDLAVCTEALSESDELMTIPCYKWNRKVLVPEGHPLTKLEKLSLEEIARFPLVSYTRGYTGRPKLDVAFAQRGLHPNVVIAASDADVIKTYVRLKMGVGIIAEMAFDADEDLGLVALEASHLFPQAMTYVAYRKDRLMKQYLFDFIRLLSPKAKLNFHESMILYHREEEKIPFFNNAHRF